MSKSVCVFSASSEAVDRVYFEAATQLGRQIAEAGWSMIFGGGATGLMGATARAVHAHGGQVIGVIPGGLNRPGITYEAAAVTVDGDRFRVVTRVGLTPHNAGDEPMVLAGLVTLGEKPDDPSYDFEIPLDQDMTWKAGALRDSKKP